MIHLEQLRLGNWVIHNENVRTFVRDEFKHLKRFPPMKVDREIMLDLLCEPRPEHYDYIQLTQRILMVDFGFKIKPSFLGCIELSFENKIDSLPNDIKLIINPNDKRYLHVHQLQNLFYSYTGIELNDIASYNYFKQLTRKNIDELQALRIRKESESITIELKNIDFESFIAIKKEYNYGVMNFNIKYKDEINYKFGDLPPNFLQP